MARRTASVGQKGSNERERATDCMRTESPEKPSAKPASDKAVRGKRLDAATRRQAAVGSKNSERGRRAGASPGRLKKRAEVTEKKTTNPVTVSMACALCPTQSDKSARDDRLS